MKHTFILLFFASVVFVSCSTAYKSAQTPDDVYYSPAKEIAYTAKATTTRDRYQENITSQDDRFLRMKIQNRDRWQNIDDYAYWYDSRYDYNTYNSNFYYNSPYVFNNWRSPNLYSGCFSPNYYGYGGYYSAAFPVIYYKNPKVYTGVTGKSNLATYMNTRYNNQNTNYSKGASYGNFGNLVKKVFTTDNDGGNSSNNSYDRPARTSTSTSAPSNSAGGRSGGYNSTGSSTGTSRPPRN
ncbi:MAG: hypothetical protein LH478_13575 [Chitinophagaceae bacterium]|nr:hypothetical protein [Chitinophagaceae bacterium]